MIDEEFKELENRVLRLGRTEWEDRAVIGFCVEADMSRDEVKRLREKVMPHMCRDGHVEIGHSSDKEMCPVCEARGLFYAANKAKRFWCRDVNPVMDMLDEEIKRLREDRKRLFMDVYEQGWEEALTAHDHGEGGRYFDVYRRNAWTAEEERRERQANI